jgi:hypothetical protein
LKLQKLSADDGVWCEGWERNVQGYGEEDESSCNGWDHYVFDHGCYVTQVVMA